MDDCLLKPREAAEVLGISQSKLSKHRWAGDGPAFKKLGRCVRYSRDDLKRWADERSRRSTSEAAHSQ